LPKVPWLPLLWPGSLAERWWCDTRGALHSMSPERHASPDNLTAALTDTSRETHPVFPTVGDYFARRNEDAVDECLKTLEMDPDFTPTFIWLGQAYLQLGRFAEAIQVFRREVELSTRRSTTLAYLATAHAVAGDGDEVRRD